MEIEVQIISLSNRKGVSKEKRFEFVLLKK